jgi:altronate hydrolase
MIYIGQHLMNTAFSLFFLRIHPFDNVAVALRDVDAGSIFDAVRVAQRIPAGHKLSLTAIACGDPVIKYGYPIGVASVDIPAGAHVHVHNLRGNLPDKLESLHFPQGPGPQKVSSSRVGDTFKGYRRPDGRVATRNEIWIVNTVGCVNVASEKIAGLANAELVFPGSGIDGIHAFPHPFGCSQLGDDLGYTRKVLVGLANHPNAAAVLVLGLGCDTVSSR